MNFWKYEARNLAMPPIAEESRRTSGTADLVSEPASDATVEEAAPDEDCLQVLARVGGECNFTYLFDHTDQRLDKLDAVEGVLETFAIVSGTGSSTSARGSEGTSVNG